MAQIKLDTSKIRASNASGASLDTSRERSLSTSGKGPIVCCSKCGSPREGEITKAGAVGLLCKMCSDALKVSEKTTPRRRGSSIDRQKSDNIFTTPRNKGGSDIVKARSDRV